MNQIPDYQETQLGETIKEYKWTNRFEGIKVDRRALAFIIATGIIAGNTFISMREEINRLEEMTNLQATIQIENSQRELTDDKNIPAEERTEEGKLLTRALIRLAIKDTDGTLDMDVIRIMTPYQIQKMEHVKDRELINPIKMGIPYTKTPFYANYVMFSIPYFIKEKIAAMLIKAYEKNDGWADENPNDPSKNFNFEPEMLDLSKVVLAKSNEKTYA